MVLLFFYMYSVYIGYRIHPEQENMSIYTSMCEFHVTKNQRGSAAMSVTCPPALYLPSLVLLEHSSRGSWIQAQDRGSGTHLATEGPGEWIVAVWHSCGVHLSCYDTLPCVVVSAVVYICICAS